MEGRARIEISGTMYGRRTEWKKESEKNGMERGRINKDWNEEWEKKVMDLEGRMGGK